MIDWAAKRAQEVYGLTLDQESGVAQFLRDERCRAARLCTHALITIGRERGLARSGCDAGIIHARRDIAAAIEAD